MIATLGGQPQVVTFALDELLARGIPIRGVMVLYLSAEGSRVNQALDRLAAEFSGDMYRGRPCRLRPQPIRLGVERLADIRSDEGAIATAEMLRDLITALKQERRQVHLCLSGGRRVMALLLMPLATFYFGYGDRVWHIYTPDEFQEQARDGAIMHARPEDGVRLLQVPVTPLGAQLPAWQRWLQSPDQPADGPGELRRQRCRAVWERISSRQREVLRLLAAGRNPQQVAEELSISVKTVSSHNTAILSECRSAWDLPEEQWLDYHFLQAEFGPFLDTT